MNQFLHSCLHSVPQTLQRWFTGVYPPLVFNLVFFTNTQLFLSGVWLTRSPHAHSVIVTWGFVLFTACLFRVLQWIDVNRRGKIKLMFSRSEVSNISVNPGGSVCGLLWTSKDAGNTYFNQDTFWSRRICNVCEFNYIVWFFFFFFPLRNNPPVLGLTVFIYSVFLFGGRSVAMATEAALLVRVIYHHRSMWEWSRSSLKFGEGCESVRDWNEASEAPFICRTLRSPASELLNLWFSFTFTLSWYSL